jgi:hypothetical protein
MNSTGTAPRRTTVAAPVALHETPGEPRKKGIATWKNGSPIRCLAGFARNAALVVAVRRIGSVLRLYITVPVFTLIVPVLIGSFGG